MGPRKAQEKITLSGLGRALGTLGPWGPLGLGDPWALGTLGLGDPWALGARALGPVYYIYGSTLVTLELNTDINLYFRILI